MKPAPFEYFCPGSLDEALKLLAAHGDNAKILAGGQSLVPMMNFRLAQPAILIDINKISGIDYHRVQDGALRIGALARHAALSGSAVVRDACPLVFDAYAYVAHATIRNRGTLCGNLCHADPASELPAIMLASDATMVLRGASGERTVRADQFFLGIYETAVQPDEILAEVRIPLTERSVGHGFDEVSVRKGDFAMVLAGALVRVVNGRIVSGCVVYGGVTDRPVRPQSIEQLLAGEKPSDALFAKVAETACAEIDVLEDLNGDRAYRFDLLRTLTPRVLSQALARAGGR